MTINIDVSGFDRPPPIDNMEHRFIDGDTLVNKEGNLLRIQGLSAPEIMRMIDGNLKPGTAGGWEATKQIRNLAEQFDFNNVHYLTNSDGTPMMDATGTRQLVRITDPDGRDFVETLNSYGIGKLNRFSSPEEIRASQIGAMLRAEGTPSLQDESLDQFDKARIAINQMADSEKFYETEFKKVALDEQTLARLNAERQPGESNAMYALRKRRAADYSNNMVYKRHGDRTLQNKALHPWSESFDTGWTGVIEGAYGMADMIGEKTGINWLEELGKEGIKRQHEYLANKPETKNNILKYKLDDDGNVTGNEWDIDGVGGFFEYMGNMTAMALPYMGVTIGGAALAPVTGGTSLAGATGIAALSNVGASMLAPVSVYAGQNWNEMEGEDKSASLAVAAGVTMSVLDRLGLKGLMGGAKGTLLDSKYRDTMIQAYKQANPGATDDIAKAAIGNMTRKESAKLAGDVVKVAKDQLKFGSLLKNFSKNAARGFGIESSTELGQELTGYMAAVYGSDKPFDSVELSNRLINAYIAGGTLGAGFSVPGTAYNAGAWADVAVRQAPAEDKRLSQEGKWAEEEMTLNNGIQRSNKDIAEEAKKRARARPLSPSDDFNAMADAGEQQAKDRDTWSSVKETAKELPFLWKGAMPHLFWKDSFQSKAIRKLGSLVNGYLHRIHSGETFEEYKHLQLAEYKNMAMTPSQVAQALGKNNRDPIRDSKLIYAFGRWLVSKGDPTKIMNIDWNTLPTDFEGEFDLKANEKFLREYYVKINKLGNKLFNDQVKVEEEYSNGTKTGKQSKLRDNNGKDRFTKNYLLKYKSLNKASIEKNKNEFIKALQDEFGFTLDSATDLTNDILDNNEMVDQESIYQVGKGKHVPAQFKRRSLGLSERARFNQFMEEDHFVNISNAAKSATRFIAYEKFLGDNNEVFAQLLREAKAEGLSEERVNRIAAGLRDYLQAESGNYKRIQNKTLENIQKNILVWTTLAGLPLATVSSFVEFMMTMRALTPEQIRTVIGVSAKEFAQALWSGITNPGINSVQARLNKEKRQARLQKLGFFDWDVGASQTTGATENTYASRYLLDKYFRVIGLQQWTDYTRNIRAAIADDFIMDHLATIQVARQGGGVKTNEVQEAEEQLRNLGINVNRLLDLANQPVNVMPGESIQNYRLRRSQTDAELDRIFMQAEYNFVNEAIALPGTANRPLFYNNPHLALFTQFQGFIATFTANQIPRMWGDYVKRGTPAMKYNAFAVMSTMVMLGFVSQYLKDLLKYGMATPYLDRAEVIQRGIGASGLIGVAERPLNFFFPIYETSSSNMVEELFQTVSGEAAALSNITRAATGVGQVVEGKTETGIYKILKTMPIIGPVNQLNRNIAELFA